MDLIVDLPQIFDEFAEQKRKSFLEVKKYKDMGIPIIGAYCSYFPRELALAVGAIPIGLCSASNETIAIAEQTLPKNVCPLIKSSYGYAVSDKCPFFYFSDIVVGETTCDGKKKMYELLANFKKVYVLELPNSQSPKGLGFWKKEILAFKEYLEDYFQVVITDEKIREAVQLCNENRRALVDVCGLMKRDVPPMTGTELFQLFSGNKYRLDIRESNACLRDLYKKLEKVNENAVATVKKPRILITGCPMGADTFKVIQAVEDNGGLVVALENCTGAKTIQLMVDESMEDIYQAIAERYLSIGCSIMTPNDKRIQLLAELIDEYRVDGVIDMTLQGCHSNAIEAVSVGHFMDEEKHVPYMEVVTDYSQADIGQLNSRIGAFIEIIKK